MTEKLEPQILLGIENLTNLSLEHYRQAIWYLLLVSKQFNCIYNICNQIKRKGGNRN
jgi:hypothetical protein